MYIYVDIHIDGQPWAIMGRPLWASLGPYKATACRTRDLTASQGRPAHSTHETRGLGTRPGPRRPDPGPIREFRICLKPYAPRDKYLQYIHICICTRIYTRMDIYI